MKARSLVLKSLGIAGLVALIILSSSSEATAQRVIHVRKGESVEPPVFENEIVPIGETLKLKQKGALIVLFYSWPSDTSKPFDDDCELRVKIGGIREYEVKDEAQPGQCPTSGSSRDLARVENAVYRYIIYSTADKGSSDFPFSLCNEKQPCEASGHVTSAGSDEIKIQLRSLSGRRVEAFRVTPDTTLRRAGTRNSVAAEEISKLRGQKVSIMYARDRISGEARALRIVLPNTRAHSIGDITFNPPSPALNLVNNQSVTVSFSYYTTHPDGVRIFVEPVVREPNFTYTPSPVYPSGRGTGSAAFTIITGNANISRVRIKMWTANQDQLLFEKLVKVRLRFRVPLGTSGARLRERDRRRHVRSALF